MIAVVVLCGGAGTRLWPASRPDRPKPLLRLGRSAAGALASGAPASGQARAADPSPPTLLRATLDRFAPLGPATLVCAPAHAQALALEAPEVPLWVEAAPRGTGPAVRLAAERLAAADPDTVVLVTPADHEVTRPEVLRAAITAAVPLARAGRVVTFGVVPTHPATGYGWIAPGEALGHGARRIGRFVEKPDDAAAAALLAAGHLWNAGLFLFRAATVVEELERLAPGDPPGAFDVLLMEKTDRGAVVPVDCGWSDLGTWDAVAAAHLASPGTLPPSPASPASPVTPGAAEAVHGEGPALTSSSSAPAGAAGGRVHLVGSPGAFAWSDGPTVAVLGLPGVRVVASGGGVLVAAPDQLDRVGRLALPPGDVLDSGPGWSVERRILGAGDALDVGPDDHAVIVAGALRGERVPSGRFVAGAACVVVVARLTTPSRSAGGT